MTWLREWVASWKERRRRRLAEQSWRGHKTPDTVKLSRKDMRMLYGKGVCVCGHGAKDHQHYREGSDCGVCGNGTCPHYQKAGR